MKKFTTVVFLLLILLPMFIYLNPFTWGMRRFPKYEPNQQTTELLSKLNKKYTIEMEVGDAIDTLWYFRDLKNNKIDKLENFELMISDNNPQHLNLVQIKSYVKDFKTNFSHKNYFDSIAVRVNYDSIIYKTKMR